MEHREVELIFSQAEESLEMDGIKTRTWMGFIVEEKNKVKKPNQSFDVTVSSLIIKYDWFI